MLVDMAGAQSGQEQWKDMVGLGPANVMPSPPKLQQVHMLNGYNPFVQGDILILKGKAWVVSGFSGSSGNPITIVTLKEVQ